MPGYGEPVVWCGWTAYYEGAVYDAFPAQVDATGGVYKGEITVPGTTYFCYWFNIPDEHSRIMIYKYNCPEGALVEGRLDGYQNTLHVSRAMASSSPSTTPTAHRPRRSPAAAQPGTTCRRASSPSPKRFRKGTASRSGGADSPATKDGAIFDGFPQQVEAPGGVFTGSIDFEVTYYFCWVFNFPDYDREVTVYKWCCPEGLRRNPRTTRTGRTTCVNPMPGVSFNLAHPDGGSRGRTPMSVARRPGTASSRVNTRSPSSILPGYESPFVFCSLEAFYEDGAAYAEDFTWYDVTDTPSPRSSASTASTSGSATSSTSRRGRARSRSTSGTARPATT